MRTLASLIALAALAVPTSSAFAEDLAAADAKAPTFATTDRQDGNARYGVDLGYSSFDSDAFFDVGWGLRVDLYGQHVVPVGTAKAGGYAQVAISSIDADGSDEEITGFELGGIYAAQMSGMEVVLHGGLVLPSGGDDLGSLITNSFAGRGRITDSAAVLGGTTWLRFAASPIIRSGNAFVRIDGGIDLPIDEGENVGDVDPLVRINAAAGLDAGAATLMAELATIYNTGDTDDDENAFHTAALGARFLTDGAVQPMVSAVLPLDESVRDFVQFTLMVGVQYTPVP
jgi:hypothetical protein